MKIDNAIKNVTAPRGKDAKPDKARSRTDPRETATVSDNVQLTESSSLLQQLEAQLASIDVSEPGKVDAIRQAIADGTFKVDEEAVAEGLVQESLENLTHQAKQ